MIFLEWYGGRSHGYCRIRKEEKEWIAIWKDIRDGRVRPRLALPSPPIPQKGGVVCVARAEFRPASPEPEKTGTRLTGHYEHSDANPGKGPVFTLRINQAGKHIECVYTEVFWPSVQSKTRVSSRLHGDLQSDGSFSLFNRSFPDFYGNLRHDAKTNRLVIQSSRLGNTTASLISRNPTLMEKSLNALPKDSEIIRRYEWYPLTQAQLRHLSNGLKEDKIASFLQPYFKTSVGTRSDQKAALNKAALPLDKYLYKVFTDSTNGIHSDDLLLARFYARSILTRNKWTRNNITRSQLDWIQIMFFVVSVDESWGRLSSIREYLGIRQLTGKHLDADQAPHKYQITLKLTGASVFVQGLQGSITVEKISDGQWKKAKAETFKIWFVGLSAGISIKPFESVTAKASTAVEWLPPDFPGTVSIVMGEISAGRDVASSGFMHIYGSGYLPPMDAYFSEFDWNIEFGFSEDLKSLRKGLKALKDFRLEAGAGIDLSGSWGRIGSKPFSDVDYSTGSVNADYAVDYKLNNDIHFCLDSAWLTEDARQALRILCANELRAFMSPMSFLKIVGHTDRSGPKKDKEEYNRKLSDLRAKNTLQAIRDILGNSFAIPHPARVKVFGEGESEAKKDLKEVNPRYRRVDINLNGRLVLTLNAE
jgi:flagellar motor protein MotB